MPSRRLKPVCHTVSFSSEVNAPARLAGGMANSAVRLATDVTQIPAIKLNVAALLAVVDRQPLVAVGTT